MRRLARLCHGAREKIKEHWYAIWLDPWPCQAGPIAYPLYPWCSEPCRFLHKVVTSPDPYFFFPTIRFLPTPKRRSHLTFPPFSFSAIRIYFLPLLFPFSTSAPDYSLSIITHHCFSFIFTNSFYSSLFLCYHIQARPPSHLAWRTGVLIFSILIL